MAKLQVKKGDAVIVIAGKDKGKSGQITSVNTSDKRVIIDGLNMVSKAVKPRSAQEKGGILKKEASVDASNVMIVCPVCGKATKVAHSMIDKDGKTVKIRVCKKCGASLEEATASKKKTAAKKVASKATKAAKTAEAKPVEAKAEVKATATKATATKATATKATATKATATKATATKATKETSTTATKATKSSTATKAKAVKTEADAK
ncbi:MAG: 50S ribosomal protein L24 [Clostridia bacterium]